jgi:hypothetical protein
MKALKLLLNAVRFVLFSVLMFVRPIFGAVFRGVSWLCLLCFVFCMIAARAEHTALWAFLIVGIASTAALYSFDFLIAMLASTDFMLIER